MVLVAATRDLAEAMITRATTKSAARDSGCTERCYALPDRPWFPPITAAPDVTAPRVLTGTNRALAFFCRTIMPDSSRNYADCPSGV
jgi:hypothetical protein